MTAYIIRGCFSLAHLPSTLTVLQGGSYRCGRRCRICTFLLLRADGMGRHRDVLSTIKAPSFCGGPWSPGISGAVSPPATSVEFSPAASLPLNSMRSLILAAVLFLLSATVFSQTTQIFNTTIAYDQTYDNGSLSTTGIACSNGINGVIDQSASTSPTSAV